MAARRMFSKSVVNSDIFLDMPISAQALYFHLGIEADDDGFVGSPKKVQRMIGASPDDLSLLIAKGFLILFENGVVVITHWKVSNFIRSDRYQPTLYQEQKTLLKMTDIKTYELNVTKAPTAWQPTGIPNVIPNGPQMAYQRDTEVSIGKDSIGKVKKEGARFVAPSLEDIQNYCRESGIRINAEAFLDHYTANGWVQNKGKPIKDWKAAVRNWARRSKEFGGGSDRMITGGSDYDFAYK